MEMVNLVRFKTATLTTLGFQRNGVWGEETAAQKIEHLGLMFGALAASPKSAVKGYGVPLSQLTFGLLVFPGIWDWYLHWREKRRGFYTKWEEDMLSILLGMVRPETGWMWQHPELVQNTRPIPGLVTSAEIAAAQKDWHVSCDIVFKHASQRSREIQRVARIHRDPFEPIMCVLEADSPLAEYRKITDEIIRRMPDEDRYPRSAAESVRSFLMLRLGLHLGLRQKNLRQLLVCPRGHFPTSERRLEDMKRGEIRWSDRDGGWEVLIPSNAFKNANSSFFGSKLFRPVLPNLQDLYPHLNAYIERHRAVLLAGGEDPGTLFVKTVKTKTKDASYDQTTFYEAWRTAIQRYGIYNPYTGRGAIKGLLPHDPHNVRDVLATHILKQTGSYEQASYAIQHTPEMVANHYGRFFPQDKAALAARILNQVWEASRSSGNTVSRCCLRRTLPTNSASTTFTQISEPRATNSFGGNVQAVSDCSAPASIAECLAWHVARATHRHDVAGRDRKRDRDIPSKRRSAGQAIPIRMHTATIRPPDGLRSKRTPLEVRQ